MSRYSVIRLFTLVTFGVILHSANSQDMPILNSSDGSYVLNIPYLEYNADNNQQAYAALLTSTNLQHFSIGSIANVDLLNDTANVSSSSISAGAFELKIPYLQVQNSSEKYSVNLSAETDLSLFEVDFQSIKAVFTESVSDFSSQLSIGPENLQTLAGKSIGSSTKLKLNWTQPENFSVDHYEISVTEQNQEREFRLTANNDVSSVTISDLKSDTNYSATLYACGDSSCSQYAIAKSQIVRTAKEYWQLQGSGNSVSGLMVPVSDGNARISATRIGPDAGTSNADTVQLYYGPFTQPGGNSTLAVAAGNKNGSHSNSPYLEFTSLAYESGLISMNQVLAPGQPIDSPNNNLGVNNNLRADDSSFSYIIQVSTGQGIPLSNGKIRLFFEATGSDNKTRVFWIDSQDGFIGQDFNSGSAMTCSTEDEYGPNGNCVPSLAIGVDGDTTSGNLKISNARQQKVGFPTQSDWRWDLAKGTFMVFTTDTVEGCSDSRMNHAYAVWDGNSHWKVQYESSGCPKMFKSAQACFPMHIGGVRYKMYCGDPSQEEGRLNNSGIPFLGPKQLLYADATLGGDIGVVDFEDWEEQSLVRDVVFLWPDGSEFSVADEGYIDDYHFLAPTGELSFQVMYMAITDGETVPVAATAILQNP